ncbi:hypothetical protein ACG7TL_006021 [Trametes sanguinea]
MFTIPGGAGVPSTSSLVVDHRAIPRAQLFLHMVCCSLEVVMHAIEARYMLDVSQHQNAFEDPVIDAYRSDMGSTLKSA